MRRDALPSGADFPLAAQQDASRAHRHAATVIAFTVLWTLGWYVATAKGMVDIWKRSDTFAHGFLVPPIAAWLVWRMRAELRTLPARPAWWMLSAVAAAGSLWLLGRLADVNAVTQFALVALLVAGIVTVLGSTFGRALAFPLAFLFLAVPAGEFLLPRLIEWTANVTIWALQVSGIPIYREGSRFVIPTGSWEVVEACSGLRYLVASFMVGTLFAYLTYRSLVRRLVFIGFSLLVPIIANWMRAYMIVMIGHLSGNKLAVGADHLLYGWVFFGIVVAFMLWVGSKWREDQDMPPAPQLPPARPHAPSKVLWTAGAAVALAVVVWKLAYLGIELADASTPPKLEAIPAVAGWTRVERTESWRPHFQRPAAHVQQLFSRDGAVVGLFVGYYRNQDSAHKLVSSSNAVVDPGSLAWIVLDDSVRTVSIDGKPVGVRSTLARTPTDERLRAWQWYWIHGRLTSSDYWGKAYTALDRLQGKGDDGAIVVVYTTSRNKPDERLLEDFVRAATPAVEAMLRRTYEAR